MAAHLVFIAIGKDYEQARATWVQRLSRRYNQDFAPLADRYGIFGTPAQCIEQMERFVEAGCRYCILDPICEPPDKQAQLETMAGEILPHFARSG